MDRQAILAKAAEKRLLALQDPEYQKFHSKLVPNSHNVLGVRTPELRKLAKEICRGDWKSFLKENDRKWYEKDVLQGLVTAGAKVSFEERLQLTAEFVPRIDNWAVCDIFCSSLKDVKTHKAEIWEFLQPYLHGNSEYEIRFGVVMLLSYFTEYSYVNKAFEAFDRITHEAYYVRMAVAWAVSVYFVHFPRETFAYLENNQLDDWTYNKALQKIIESYRVDASTKQRIREMKRQGKREHHNV